MLIYGKVALGYDNIIFNWFLIIFKLADLLSLLTLIKNNKKEHVESDTVLEMDSQGHRVRGILYTAQGIVEHLLNGFGFQHKECYDER